MSSMKTSETILQSIEKIHDDAMNCIDKSLMDHNQILKGSLYRSAYEFEMKAAAMMYPRYEQPTRAILFRSAATIAWEVGEIAVARMLATIGLEKNPPKYVEEELREIISRKESEV